MTPPGNFKNNNKFKLAPISNSNNTYRQMNSINQRYKETKLQSSIDSNSIIDYSNKKS